MEALEKIWGEGEGLNSLQMAVRGIIVFIIALIILRISGRRSFGVGTPVDNIVVILLGAILSRAVTGASPFIPVLVASLVIALLHRFFSWYKVGHTKFESFAEGDKILLYENSNFIKSNMSRALVGVEDIMQAIREKEGVTNMNNVDKVYMERNGTITITRIK
ncbi:MAG: DUF421 domain-containing protein [Sphingobacteriales bacterium]|nr:MAG: DUF421 domain-containing protein [Sphingobacteriales bacterium]